MLLASFPISLVRIRDKLHSIIFQEDTEGTVVIPEQRDEDPNSLAQLHPVNLTAFLLHTCCDLSFMIIFKCLHFLHCPHFQVGCFFILMAITSEKPVTLGNTVPKYSLSPTIL